MIKYYFNKIKNIIKWLPILWEQEDYDYHYALEVFKFQLSKTADFLDSDKTNIREGKDLASRIRVILKLMDKVYDEDYAMEYQKTLADKYGKTTFEFNLDNKFLEYNFELDDKYSKEEKKDLRNEMVKELKKSRLKQERAHKLLWDLVEHNIRRWWD